MRHYLDALREVLDEGIPSSDRTGTGTVSLFGMQRRYRLAEGFPLVTTKKMHLKSIIHELLWFLSGDTNVGYLRGHGVSIWDAWADGKGDLGPIYGRQWRRYPKIEIDGGQPVVGEVDQIADLVEAIRATPDSRRLIVSAWNPGELDAMALPPCHALWQVRVQGRHMHLHLYQRSADMFLGVPFNIASYALLLEMLAHVTGHEAGDFIHSIGDAHIYSNHMDQVREQLTREPRSPPRLRIARKVESLCDFTHDDFVFEGYDPHPGIKAPVAV